MDLMQMNNTAKRFGGRLVFGDLHFTVAEGARIGLVGPNGSGKSTLLRIAHGSEEVDAGEVVRRRGLVTAYLPQHIAPASETPVQVVMAARSDVGEVERELISLEERLGWPEVVTDLTKMERLLSQQERALQRLEDLGASGIEGEARATLLNLGLKPAGLAAPLRHLSGGERKLVFLAACLNRKPDLLLLDEPETHLDLRARQLLESTISDFDGAVVVVSHDRYLLDETVSQIAQLESGGITWWKGNYSAYAVERELALHRQQTQYVTQQKEIARLEDAVRRFKEWAHRVVDERHIRQAWNKQRQIDSMDKVERPVLERRKMKLRLSEQHRSGQKVVEVKRVDVDVDQKTLLREVNLTVWRGERIGVIGGNGAGKTMLIRLLLGELPPVKGSVWQGPSVRLGRFFQSQDDLALDSTPLELVRGIRPMREDQAVAQLMKFLFSYEQVRCRVEKLSGGEQSRLQLLLLMLGESNCLLLDEPTNHLDIDSLEVLEQALEDYDGTVVFVSHDRYFLDRLADRIVEVEQGEIKEHAGGYSDWLMARSRKSPGRELVGRSP